MFRVFDGMCCSLLVLILGGVGRFVYVMGWIVLLIFK